MKTRNSKDISNGNTNKSAKVDATVPDGIAPIARTEEMSDDLSEETLVNGESTNDSAGKQKYREIKVICKSQFCYDKFTLI